MCKLDDIAAVERMQPHQLEAELALPPQSSGPHEWKWMRLAILLRRDIKRLEAKVDVLLATRQKGAYYAPKERKDG